MYIMTLSPSRISNILNTNMLTKVLIFIYNKHKKKVENRKPGTIEMFSL